MFTIARILIFAIKNKNIHWHNININLQEMTIKIQIRSKTHLLNGYLGGCCGRLENETKKHVNYTSHEVQFLTTFCLIEQTLLIMQA